MPLPASGPISLSQIAAEFGGAMPHSLSEYYGKAAGIPASGQISFSQFHGKTSGFQFNPVISADTTNYNLKAAAIAAGWNQTLPLIATVTINSGVVVSANATNAYAFDTGVTFPAGSSLTLNMQGAYVIGMGGSGAELSGQPGGPALRAQHALTVNATGGVIGGGGGGGARVYSSDGYFIPGGGGRTGRTNSDGTNQGTFTSGGSTSYAAGGTTGAGADAPGPFYSGGGGGGWGAAGGRGYIYGTGPSGIGGAGGAAVVGNANITWVNTGTRYGAIT